MRARRASIPIRIVLSCLSIYANATFGAEDDFQKLYDYYFPKESQDVRASYRRYFDKLLFGSPPRESETKRASQVYYALRGDDAAFHAFLHNSDWAVNGAPGEECVYESVLLLLRLGDDHFSQLLAREDAQTRNKVGYAIEPQVDWTRHQFAKTRALYSYRYVPPTQREREQRNREPLAVAWKGVAQDQWKRIGEALEKEKRFSGAQMTSTDGGITSITVPKSMSKRDKDDLQRLIRRELKGSEGVHYYP